MTGMEMEDMGSPWRYYYVLNAVEYECLCCASVNVSPREIYHVTFARMRRPKSARIACDKLRKS